MHVCPQLHACVCQGTGWSRHEAEGKLTFRNQFEVWNAQVQYPSRSEEAEMGQDGKDRCAKYSSANTILAHWRDPPVM